MRIVVVNNTLDEGGGAERYTHDIVYGLRQEGHQVFLGGFSWGEKRPSEGATLLSPSCEETLKALGPFRPEVVYLQNIFQADLIEALSRAYPTWRFIHDHATYCPGHSKYWFKGDQICPVPVSWQCGVRAFTKRCMSRRPAALWQQLQRVPQVLTACRQLRGLVVASDFMKSQLILNQIPQEKITVNPLFVNPRWPLAASQEGQETEPPTILYVGRVYLEKGVEYLLRAGRLLKNNFRLKIIGDGWDLPRLKNLAAAWGMTELVEFTGWLPHKDVARHFQEARLLVVPSIWGEPFGIIGLEAMYYQKPVVAFDSGGIATWLRDGETGFLVPRLSVEGLAEKIDQLLAAPSLAQKLGKQGHQRLTEEFTLKRHLSKLEEIFKNV